MDGRGDIYSLGLVLYHMLAGRLPFETDNLMSLMYLQVHEPPKPLHEVRPEVPNAVSDVIQRMLAKRPEDRYATPLECAEARREPVGLVIVHARGVGGADLEDQRLDLRQGLVAREGRMRRALRARQAVDVALEAGGIARDAGRGI